jgi:hypothetical protein
MFNKQVNSDRYEIEKSLSWWTIKRLAKDKSIKVLQFSEPVKKSTFKRLNDYFFSVREDVELRAYGFYSNECDLSFTSEMTNLRHFAADSLTKATSIESIPKMTRLKSLSIGIYELDSFDFLHDVSDKIENLNLQSTKSNKPDLAVISRFKNLKTLYLEGQQKNIEVISKLTNLEDITLRSISTPTLDYLKPLKNVWSLAIKLGGIKDFSAIENMNQIKYLELWQIRGLSDLSFISKISKLEYLFLQSLSQLKSIPNLTKCKNLKRIHLESLKSIKNLAPLKEAPSLEELTYLDASQLQPEDFTPALENKNLERVIARFGSIKKNEIFEELMVKYEKKNHEIMTNFKCL